MSSDLGFRRQFGWNFSVDVACVNKTIIKENYDAHGNQRILARRCEQAVRWVRQRSIQTRGLLYRVTNGDWSWTTYNAFQMVLTKNMSHNFQVVSTIHRQWAASETAPGTRPIRRVSSSPTRSTTTRTSGGPTAWSITTASRRATPSINNPMWELHPSGSPAPITPREGRRVLEQLHDRRRTMDWPDHRSASGKRSPRLAIRTWDGRVLDRRRTAEPAGDPHPLLRRLRQWQVHRSGPRHESRRRSARAEHRSHRWPEAREADSTSRSRNLETAFNVFNSSSTESSFSEYIRSGANSHLQPVHLRNGDDAAGSPGLSGQLRSSGSDSALTQAAARLWRSRRRIFQARSRAKNGRLG